MGVLVRGAAGAALGVALLVSVAGCDSRDGREVTGLGYDSDCRHEGSGCHGGVHPVVVANPDAAEYLVLWQAEYRPSDAQLYARRVRAKTGEPLGESVSVASLGEGEASVDAAYDESTGRYLVAWTSTPTYPVRGGTSGPEFLELSTRLRVTARQALPDIPAFLLSLSMGSRRRAVLASLRYLPSRHSASGLGASELALTPMSASTGPGPSPTLDRGPQGTLGGALSPAPEAGRHLAVSYQREPDAFQNPETVPFVTTLVNESGHPIATGRVPGVRGRLPLSVDVALNRRRSEYPVAWAAWSSGNRRWIFAQRLNTRGRPLGSPFTVAESPGIPDAIPLTVDSTADGYALAWADSDKGWLHLINPERPAASTRRLIFDKPPPGEGFTTSAATNVRAGTHAHAWTEGNADPDGSKVYIRVVPVGK